MAHPDDGDLLIALARAVHAHADADGKKEIAELVARRGIDLEAKPAPAARGEMKADPKADPKLDPKDKPSAHGKA
jgi:hypothetical protein